MLGPAVRELDEVNNKINSRSKVVARSHLHTKSAHKVGTPDLKTPITLSIHDIERAVERQKSGASAIAGQHQILPNHLM